MPEDGSFDKSGHCRNALARLRLHLTLPSLGFARDNGKDMADPEPKPPPPDADPERFPAQSPPVPVREPDDPDPDVIDPMPEPLPA